MEFPVAVDKVCKINAMTVEQKYFNGKMVTRIVPYFRHFQ